ncbi:MAG: hypothetical protein P1U61_04270 [Legionellaceae bacterium]|nr:hypothetical protein [Legionellaceae bacterium]
MRQRRHQSKFGHHKSSTGNTKVEANTIDLEQESTVKVRELTAQEIKEKSMILKDTGRRVSQKDRVFKRGNRHVLFQDGEPKQVICYANRSEGQGRYLYYSGKAVLPHDTVVGRGGNKHRKTYVENDGKKIPVYRKYNWFKFIFSYPDGSDVPPDAHIELVGDNHITYARKEGELQLVTRKMVRKKNTLPLFKNLVQSLLEPTPIRENGIDINDEALEDDETRLADVLYECENQGKITPPRIDDQDTNAFFSPGTLALLVSLSQGNAAEDLEKAESSTVLEQISEDNIYRI